MHQTRPSISISISILTLLAAAAVTMTAFAGTPACPCTGDLTDDGMVDGADLGLLLAAWGSGGPADLNGDGVVNGADLGVLLAGWGPCTLPPINDTCAAATEIVLFSGTSNPFCTLNATSDGPLLPEACGVPEFDAIEHDVWFRVLSPTTATLQIGVCADFPVRFAVYTHGASCGCGVNGGPNWPGLLVACGGTQSFPVCPQGAAVLVPAFAGQCFMIRVGGPAGAQGFGNVDINVYALQCNLWGTTTLSAPELASGSQFGLATDLFEQLGVATAPFDDTGANNAGSLRLYTTDGTSFNFSQTLTGFTPFNNRRLGLSVGIGGETLGFQGTMIAAGAGSKSLACQQDPDCDSGSVHIFRKLFLTGTAWVTLQQLFSDGLSPKDRYGARLAIDGNRLLVSAWDDDNANGQRAGAVYAYSRGNAQSAQWVLDQKILAGDGGNSHEFGSSVAIRGTRAVIGARKAGGPGAAYVFEHGAKGWVQVAKLQPADLPAQAGFGDAVAVDGDHILVGAPLPQTQSGSVHTFQRFEGFGWLRTKVLKAGDANIGDLFGSSIALDGSFAMVGARQNDSLKGTAYAFQRFGGGWLQRARFASQKGDLDERFGQVSLRNGRTLIGAYGAGGLTGAVYFFKGIGDCNANGRLDMCEIVAGTVIDSDGNGVPDVCE